MVKNSAGLCFTKSLLVQACFLFIPFLMGTSIIFVLCIRIVSMYSIANLWGRSVLIKWNWWTGLNHGKAFLVWGLLTSFFFFPNISGCNLFILNQGCNWCCCFGKVMSKFSVKVNHANKPMHMSCNFFTGIIIIIPWRLSGLVWILVADIESPKNLDCSLWAYRCVSAGLNDRMCNAAKE